MKSTELNHIICEPNPHYLGEPEIATQGLFLVMSNDLGNWVQGNGDAGRKLQGACNRLGIAGLAYDRIFTGKNPNNGKITQANYDETAEETVDFIHRALDRHINDGNEVRSLVFAGHSSAGSEAVKNVCYWDSVNLPVSHVALMDPIGVREVSVPRGFLAWMKHQIFVETKHENPPRPYDDPEDATPGIDLHIQLRDMRANRHNWRYAHVTDHLLHIAGSKLQTAVRTEFPEFTFNDSATNLRHLIGRLNDERPPGPRVANFETVFAQGRSHADYLNFRIYAESIAKVIDPSFVAFAA